MRELLRLNHAGLNGMERAVILQRFPVFSGARPRTLAEIAKMVGMTNEGVRQVQRRALAKLQVVFEDQFAA